jgi:hypothetical protein
MKLATKILGSVAISGILASGGGAFTAAGLTTTGSAGSGAFVGGSVSQTVHGATLKSVVYRTVGSTNVVDQITLTFTGSLAEMAALADRDASDITAVATGSAGAGFTCLAAVQGEEEGVDDDTAVSVCAGSRTGVTARAVTVAGGEL